MAYTYKIKGVPENEQIVVEFYADGGGGFTGVCTIPIDEATKKRIEYEAKKLAVDWQRARAVEIEKQKRTKAVADKISNLEAVFPSSRSLTEKEIEDFKRDNKF